MSAVINLRLWSQSGRGWRFAPRQLFDYSSSMFRGEKSESVEIKLHFLLSGNHHAELAAFFVFPRSSPRSYTA